MICHLQAQLWAMFCSRWHRFADFSRRSDRAAKSPADPRDIMAALLRTRPPRLATRAHERRL